MAKRKEKELDLPCSFGGVSIGDKTARIGVSIDRSSMELEQADSTLCARRLTATLVSKPAGENPDQLTLDGVDADPTLEKVSVDVKGFGVSTDHLTFGITFNRKDLDLETLANFAKRSGRVTIHNVAAIPESEANGDEHSEE